MYTKPSRAFILANVEFGERERECVCAYVCVFLFAGRALLDIALHTVDVL